MNALSGNDEHGAVDEDTKKLRSSFTNNPNDNYKFKLPQLYNLADVAFFGHCGSFASVRDVIAY